MTEGHVRAETTALPLKPSEQTATPAAEGHSRGTERTPLITGSADKGKLLGWVSGGVTPGSGQRGQ